MRALFRAIASVLCSWLNLRRRPQPRVRHVGTNVDEDAPYETGAVVVPTTTQPRDGRATGHMGGTSCPTTEHSGESQVVDVAELGHGTFVDSVKQATGSRSEHGEDDNGHVVVSAGEPSPPPATGATSQLVPNGIEDSTGDGVPPDGPEVVRASATACATDTEPRSETGIRPAANPEGELESLEPGVAGAAAQDNDACGAPHDLAARTDQRGSATSGNEQSRPCPRCGVTCPPDEVERVFGYRTSRWTVAGRETAATPRQSYCRQCRAAHAAEGRQRSLHDDQSATAQPSRLPPSTTTDDETPVSEHLVSTDDLDLLRTATGGRLEPGPPARGEDEGLRVNDPSEWPRVTDGSTNQGHGAIGEPVVDSHRETQGLDEEQEDDVDKTESVNAGTARGRSVDEGADHTHTPNEVESTTVRNGGATGADSRVPSVKPLPSVPAPPPAASRQDPRRAPKYRAPVGSPTPRHRSSHARTTPVHPSTSLTRTRAAAIHIRAIFQRGGYCKISLLPRRLPELPEEIIVSGDRDEVTLRALQDQWYQDVAPENLAELLRTGLVWENLNSGQEWLLSGREVFVLAHNTTHRGFVSCSRLVLGRNHVVLCTATQLEPVENALRVAGCADWSQLREEDGPPAGWRLLREVVPQKPVPLSNDADIMNILRPLPDVEVALEGGIRLAYNTWLLGYPPAIHVYGAPEHTETVLIDGREAAVSELGVYTVPGWDAEGNHRISCGNTSKSFSLVRSGANWAYWPAYSFAIRNWGGQHAFEFCGPLVRPVATGKPIRRPVLQVPATNPVLLGPRPGEVLFARPRTDVRGAQCLGLPPFDPVWAVPPNPLRCDKRKNRVLLVGDPELRLSRPISEPTGSRLDLERWCQAILDANRKGLAVVPTSSDQLWREYRQLARSLRRNSR